ncbi:hypothetical protein [Kitasatospora sp. NPDC087315]|uniref:hypothetical protein n=1 Tax=Kitasatospora sp. NPDC087315 TaxID=3364069 RepID=UPI00380E8CCB
MSGLRFSAAVGIVCAAVVCAGCTSEPAAKPADGAPAGTSAATVSASVSSPSPVAPATPTVDPNVVPGSVLKTYLPTGDTLPAGWQLSPIFTESDSGPAQVPPSAAPSPTLLPSCEQLASHGTAAALGSPAAYASEGVVGPSAGEVGITVNSYHAGDAARVLSRLTVLKGVCGSTYEIGSSGGFNPVTVTVSGVDGLGAESVLVKVDRKAYVGKEFVVARVGDRVLSVSSDNKYGAFPDVVALAKAIVPQVK